MLSSCDAASSRGGIGTIRTMCLLVVTVGLVILFISSYVDRYESEICARKELTLRDHEQGRVQHDVVKRRVSSSLADNDDDLETEQVGGGRNSLRAASAERKNRSASSSTSSASASEWDYDWDASAGDFPESERNNIADRTLILVRHGQYDLATEQLTDLGREQAMMTGKRLREANLSYTEIIHSTMDRAAETARIIHKVLGNPNLPIRPDDSLVEGGPIPPQPTITYWQLPQKSYHRDGPRMEAAFRKYFHRGERNLQKQTFQILVGHGNIFRFFALRALQLSRDAWMRVFIAHASITMLHIRPDGTVSMTKFGDAGHFPYNKVTY